MANHTRIEEMHPRFLILDFANHFTEAQVMARFNLHKQALMEGSRYHGYKDPEAKPFMIWEVFRHVNLKDDPIPPDAVSRNSTKMPRATGLPTAPGGATSRRRTVRTLDRWQNHPVARAMPGGAWFLYWWQNWPGYGNKARLPDGTPMKNW